MGIYGIPGPYLYSLHGHPGQVSASYPANRNHPECSAETLLSKAPVYGEIYTIAHYTVHNSSRLFAELKTIT